jgi:hypothetical protein
MDSATPAIPLQDLVFWDDQVSSTVLLVNTSASLDVRTAVGAFHAVTEALAFAEAAEAPEQDMEKVVD